MRLVPREQDKLMLHYAGMLARDRKAQGLKLNYPEAVAYISMEVMEKARAGASAAELMQYGTKLLTADDVMDGDTRNTNRIHNARRHKACDSTQPYQGCKQASPRGIYR